MFPLSFCCFVFFVLCFASVYFRVLCFMCVCVCVCSAFVVLFACVLNFYLDAHLQSTIVLSMTRANMDSWVQLEHPDVGFHHNGTCVNEHAHMCVHACARARARACMSARIGACMCVCVCVCVSVHAEDRHDK
jgi:hypothetical protein